MEAKLFILIRSDMPVADQGVQAGHLVAEWCITFYAWPPASCWTNSTLIYLEVPDEQELDMWLRKLNQRGLDHVIFCEPDMNNKISGIACAAFTDEQAKLFSRLPLWLSSKHEPVQE